MAIYTKNRPYLYYNSTTGKAQASINAGYGPWSNIDKDGLTSKILSELGFSSASSIPIGLTAAI